MKKMISLFMTAIMVFSLVPALFVRDGQAVTDKFVKNTSGSVINVFKEANDASTVVGTLNAGAVAKYEGSNGAFLRIANPAGFVKTSQVTILDIELKAEGGLYLKDGKEHKVKVTMTNGDGFTIEYSVDSGKTWSTTVPSLSDPGKLKVKVRACKDNVILNHKDVTLEVTENPPEGTEITIIAHSGQTEAPVRAGASAGSAKIGTAKAGQKYTMIEREGSWYKFKFGSDIGYIYYWFVKVGEFSSETDVEPDPSKAKLTAKGGTYMYDGKEHKVTAKLEDGEGYTIEYSTDGGKTWSTKVPGQTEVGTLTVKVRATGGSSQLTHKDVIVEVLEKIPDGTKITIVAHGSTTKAPVREGTGSSAAKIGTANPGETFELLGRSGSWYKIDFAGQPGYVYYWFVKEGELPETEAPATVPGPDPDPAAKLTVKGGTFMYDGKEHKVTATLENGTGYTVEFSVDGGKTWSTAVPGLTEPGKLTVKARATGGKSVLTHKDVTLTVTKSAPVGTAITIVAHGSNTVAPVRAEASSSGKKVGSLPAGTHGTLQGQSGSWCLVKCGDVEGYVYEWFVKTGTIPADEEESSESPDPTNAKLTAKGGVFIYDGKAHKVTAKLENGAGFTIEYSTNAGKKWSTTVPSLTEVGKLTVKVRATGGGHIISCADVTLQVIEGIPAGTDITIKAHGSQTTAPVRASASSSAAKVGTLNAGDSGKLIKQEGVWYKVECGDVVGYVYQWFVQVGPISVED